MDLAVDVYTKPNVGIERGMCWELYSELDRNMQIIISQVMCKPLRRLLFVAKNKNEKLKKDIFHLLVIRSS